MPEPLTVSKFLYESLASASTNQLPLSSVCNASCFFCSNCANPFPIIREGFRPLDDVMKGITFLDGKDEIRLGDSLPGRISEGEALLHPEILTILKLLREHFPATPIQIPTNGILLTPEFIGKLVPFRPLKLTISYHSDDPVHWCRIFSRGRDCHRVAREAFAHLLRNGFDIEGALVPMPALVGYEDLENTIRTLRVYTRHALVYLPGWSRKTPPSRRRFLDVDFVELSRFITEMRKRYSMDLSVLPDPLEPLTFHPSGLMKEAFRAGFKNVLWLFSEAAHESGSRILQECNPFVPNDHHPALVRNLTYGGNIVCAGLLMVSDFRTALKESLRKLRRVGVRPDLILLPEVAFDRYGDDLKCENFRSLQEQFKRAVWVR